LNDDTAAARLAEAAATVDHAMARLEGILARIGDGDLHRAHPSGGWTVAQVVSHINLSTVLWLGNIERLRHDPDLRFFFREQIGHDAVGYPPPTADLARRQVASSRRTLATCLPATDPAVLYRSVEIPDLGTRTVLDWMPGRIGHLTGHVDQAVDILRGRDALPEGV
jgi:hypothetical protein